MADDQRKPPPDEVATLVRQDAPEVSEPDVAATKILDDPQPVGEAATVAIDNEATAEQAAQEAARAREVDPEAPTEYDGRIQVEEEESPPEIEPGTVLFGEYEVAERIGAGGMGEVYRARHRRLDEDRAIKVIRPMYTADKAASRLFDREARALLKIHHPAVVRCHDMLSDETGRVYLVMEFVEGRSLADLLLDGPLEPKELEELAARLAAGLSAAHAEGVVHRDLSPDNVVLPGGSCADAKLIDFGIAKETERSETTILDGFKGKVLYASPEQIGFFDGEVDRRSDYFSLGLLLATASIGEPLPMGGTLIQAVEARRNTPTLPPGISQPMRSKIKGLLAVDPSRRPDTLDGLMPDRRTAGVAAPAGAGSSRTPALLAGGIGVLAAAAAGAYFLAGPGTLAPVEPSAKPPDRVAPVPVVAPVTPEPVAVAPVVEEPVAEPAKPAPVAKPVADPVEKSAAKRVAKAPSASDRAAALRGELRVEGLMAGARAALADGRLTSPPGDNAVEKLEAVLKLDPSNSEARSSMNAVGGRLLEKADAAIVGGDVDAAQGYVDTAARLAPAHPALAEVRTALSAAR